MAPCRSSHGSANRDQAPSRWLGGKANFRRAEPLFEDLGNGILDHLLRPQCHAPYSVHHIVDDLSEYSEGVRRE
jgi:hypothetical protein